ncbi:MAG: hypothetical protein HY781_11020 [Chloroflexi bacterium]|nr:hypothetical protein [Chloroflexota bacterium]
MQNSSVFLRIGMAITVVLVIAAMIQADIVVDEFGISLFASNWGVPFYFLLGTTLLVFAVTWNKSSMALIKKFSNGWQPERTWRIATLVLFSLFLSAFSLLSLIPLPVTPLVLLPRSELLKFLPLLIFQQKLVRLTVFWLLAIVAALILTSSKKRLTIETATLAAILGEAVVYRIFRFIATISTYPFALTWEESHRPYSASLVAAERIYGKNIPLSLSDFSLNLVNGVPFLFCDVPIWLYRLWVTILWIGVSALVIFLLLHRLKIKDRLILWLFAGWLFLYLLQEGGIKYNLLLSVAIVLAGFSVKHPWRALGNILLASIWAGLSRVNWYPVPAMLAAILFLLEEPVKNYRNIAQYLFKPLLWGIAGVAAAVATNIFVSHTISGTGGSFGVEQLQSAFLWYRLLPNATYPLGILPAILLVSLPLLLICLHAPRGRWHFIRVSGLITLVAVLFAGGLVVSVNIGGGSDLHNMDAYQVAFVLIAAYIFFDRFIVDKPMDSQRPAWFVIALALIFPIWSAISVVQPPITFDQTTTTRAIHILKQEVGQAAQQGEVLFMYERPLITFGYIDVPLVTEYESVTIFGPARAGDETFLARFYRDLETHRFSLIVTEPQPRGLQDNTHGFGEENNVFFTAVTEPMLCYYELFSTVPEASIELYTPRMTPGECEFTVSTAIDP